MSDVTACVPYTFAKTQGVLPWREADDSVVALMRSDASVDAVQEIRRVLNKKRINKKLVLEEVSPERFAEALARAYNVSDESSALALNDELARDADLSQLLQEMPGGEDLLDNDAQAPVIRMINALLLQALREQVSDIHFEPYEARSVVRFRLDGMLRDIIEPPRALHAALVSRLKIMASLDIAEKRLPQDGRITLRLGGKSVDVRVSTLPTGYGERVVLRLLDKESARLDLAALGMGDALLNSVDHIIREPHGIFLVTGPTGSGKTTTLYAALSRLDRTRINVMTVEDPIEYALDGVAQTQVNPRIDLSFARALRALLRQDPDVIMIGEIRDLETAQIAVQASLTGHLVLATLHTNDAPSAVTRLADMGVEPYLLASGLLGVLAQRLVRVLCPHCRASSPPDEGEQKLLIQMGWQQVKKLYSAQGCDACNHTGYRGRTGVYELLRMDDTLRRHIHENATEDILRSTAAQAGMRSLRQDGVRWLENGTTSLAELIRVTRQQ